MKINSKIISIPPYISSSWSHIEALYTLGANLVIKLLDGKIIEIPELEKSTINMIFEMHTLAAEEKQSKTSNQTTPFNPQIEPPFRLAIGPIEDMGASIFQHNPSFGSIAEIPSEILEKIVAITKIVSPTDMRAFPKPEPHCNCVHCQVARAVTKSADDMPEEKHTDSVEEIISDAELTFQEWEIHSIGNQTYCVINKIDKSEYRVYLGDPVGCTCGNSGCEHIIAVLKS